MAGSDRGAVNAPDQGQHRLRLITDLARQITARHDLADVLAGTLAGMRDLVEFDGGSIQLLDDEGWIRLAAADPAPTDEVLALRIPLGGSIGGQVILTERSVYLPDVLAEPSVTGEGAGTPSTSTLRSRVSPGGIRSYFGVPLLADGRAIGLLQIDAARTDAWDEQDRLLLLAVAPVVAAAIQNARAYSRVAVLTAARRRDGERLGLVAEILDKEIDAALVALVALSEESPLVRDQVDRLTTALARVRGTLADVSPAATTATPAGTTAPRQAAPSAVDLRGTTKSRA